MIRVKGRQDETETEGGRDGWDGDRERERRRDLERAFLFLTFKHLSQITDLRHINAHRQARTHAHTQTHTHRQLAVYVHTHAHTQTDTQMHILHNPNMPSHLIGNVGSMRTDYKASGDGLFLAYSSAFQHHLYPSSLLHPTTTSSQCPSRASDGPSHQGHSPLITNQLLIH